jgi:SEC-C motif-containing protein
VFKKCCGRLIGKKAKAATPLALMRSRYSAYATGAVAYIIATTVPHRRSALDAQELAAWSAQTEWLGLEILDSKQEGEHGFVAFVARYRMGEETHIHREYSTFCRIDGSWYYDDFLA